MAPISPEQREIIESQVDRALRRGELALAREGLSKLLAAFPHEEALRLRLADVEESALPGELTAPPRRAPLSPPPEPAPGSSQLVAEGERLFHAGDFPGALAAYRRALHERPDSELLKERLVELYQLSQAASPLRTGTGPGTATVASAEPSEAPFPAELAALDDATGTDREAPMALAQPAASALDWHDAAPSSLLRGEEAAKREAGPSADEARADRLQTLLERITTRRRG